MRSLYPVSRARHGAIRWRWPDNHRFAAATPLIALGAGEVAAAARTFPLAFVPRSEGWHLMVLLGLRAAQNLWVNAQGGWEADFRPARLVLHPFDTLTDVAGNLLLAIDEGSTCVTIGGAGTAIFDAADVLTAEVQQVQARLMESVTGEAQLVRAGAVLHAAGVLEPWSLPEPLDGDARPLAGLHQVNEAALSRLDDAAFNALRRAGVIGVAYAQLLSTGHVATLLRREQAQAEARQLRRAPVYTLAENQTIDWDWNTFDGA